MKYDVKYKLIKYLSVCLFALIRLKDLSPFKLHQKRVHHMRVNLNFFKYMHRQSNITQPTLTV